MNEKSQFSGLVKNLGDVPEIAPETKACVNCAHGRLKHHTETQSRYISCHALPPTVLVVGMSSKIIGQPNSIGFVNRWPAMALDEECDTFVARSKDTAT